jgi:hypothetical protein
MRLPVIQGVIERRILVNFRVDAKVAASFLPQPFRPKLVEGFAMAGICLIRLKHIRPALVSIPAGIGSENAAHRFAVEWDREGKTEQGVFIPRRDTSSRLNSMVGGRLFPGEHHHAKFEVKETDDELRVGFESDDGTARAKVVAKRSTGLPAGSVFKSMDSASEFFKAGSLGYSATRDAGRYDGLELRCQEWAVEALKVESVESSFFEDESKFPKGSVEFDNALLMRGVEHEWHGREDLHAGKEDTASG